jgi:1,4-dihydroxy-6-naphthoate synthase
MRVSLGFSPCPNDTFIFDALVNKKIDTGDFHFEVMMEDVQTLNEWAVAGKLDVTKISFATLPMVAEEYILLNSGAALGRGTGPLLISKVDIPETAVRHCTVAIPGQNTTANVLFSLAYPEATNKIFLRYNEIENFVSNGPDNLNNVLALRLGVIIHENRFTYESKGLVKITDLGDYWEKETGLPIPLGGIVARRSFDAETLSRIQTLIYESIRYSYAQSPALSDFVKEHSQEMSEDVMRQHIDLYVNEHSLTLGPEGREAVQKFVQIHSSIHKIDVATELLMFPSTR